MWRQAVERAPTIDGSVQRLCILGSTGSIGTQTLEIVRLFPDRFEVYALSARSSVDELAAQVREFKPRKVVIGDDDAASRLRPLISGVETEILVGEEGLCAVASDDAVDTVVASVVGFAGLSPVLAALDGGKKVALANKETLVVAGALVSQALKRNGGMLLPVDSEHSSIFQCLVCEMPQDVERLVLTASGGPIRRRDPETFADITPSEALDHPNWSMGAKITIDSASMMNKGLEVIEAHWIFGLDADEIDVLVHPQSIIHSMVTFQDGSSKAQLGLPDMKVPIQYALTYPERWHAPHARLDWTEISQLDFESPDEARFPCLRLAYDALREGGTAPAALNAANEEAVDLFLKERIRFVDIPDLIAGAVAARSASAEVSLDELIHVDRFARRHVEEAASRRVHSLG